MSRSAIAWMVLAALSAASMGACVRAIGADAPWQLVVLSRTGIGLAFALAVARLSGAHVPFPGPRELWLRSACASAGILLTFYAVSRMPVADTIVLVNSSPLWLTLLGALALGQRPRASSWVMLALGTLGILLVIRPHFAQRNWGALAAAGTGVLGAVSFLAVSRLRHVAAPAVVVHVSAAGLVSSVGAAVWAAADLRAVTPTARTVVLLVLVAGLGTLSQIGLTRAYTSANAARIAPLQYLSVAFATALDLLLFDVRANALTMLGIAAIVLPAVWLGLTKPAPLDVRVGVLGDALTELPDVDGLESAIRRAERLTSCEVRVHVERGCDHAAPRARQVFSSLEMEKTRLRNGVLVYLALDAKAAAVVVDRGISDLVPPAELARLSTALEAAVRAEGARGLEEGLVALLGGLGRWFPWQTDDVNELPDAISVDW